MLWPRVELRAERRERRRREAEVDAGLAGFKDRPGNAGGPGPGARCRGGPGRREATRRPSGPRP